MLQIFISISGQEILDFEKEDSLPVSEDLLQALQARFVSASSKTSFLLEYRLSASEALDFLRDFYGRYELSRPQRRVFLRFEEILTRLPSDAQVRLIAAEVSGHRSRKYLKKTEQPY